MLSGKSAILFLQKSIKEYRRGALSVLITVGVSNVAVISLD